MIFFFKSLKKKPKNTKSYGDLVRPSKKKLGEHCQLNSNLKRYVDFFLYIFFILLRVVLSLERY
jgi:hypothetical protein